MFHWTADQIVYPPQFCSSPQTFRLPTHTQCELIKICRLCRGLTYGNRCTKALAKQSAAKSLCTHTPFSPCPTSPLCKTQHELSGVEAQPKPKPKPKQAKQIRQQLTRLEASQHSSSYSHNFRRLASAPCPLCACPTVHLFTVGRTGPKCRCQWLIYANGHNKWGAHCQPREGERERRGRRVDESKLGAWGKSNWMPTAQWKRLIWCWNTVAATVRDATPLGKGSAWGRSGIRGGREATDVQRIAQSCPVAG